MLDAPLQSLINGQQAEHISIRDRGFQYGDGCFETVRVLSNNPILWSAHLKRLRRACMALHLSVDFDLLQREIEQLLQTNAAADVILKITITRGVGGRGYAPPEQANCTRVLQLLDYKSTDNNEAARVLLCEHRLSSNAGLAGIKHLNRLDQVLASAEILPDYDEGLCMDESGSIIEGCKSNILLVVDDNFVTPELGKCGVEGVMLNHLIEELGEMGVLVTRRRVSLEQLRAAQHILLCNSVFGLRPVVEIRNEYWRSALGEHPCVEAAQEIRDALFRD